MSKAGVTPLAGVAPFALWAKSARRAAEFGLGLALLWAAAATAQTGGALFPPGPLLPTQVRQGELGSCYFHAAIASWVAVDPAAVRRLIAAPAGDGILTVDFFDGGSERVRPADVAYARTSGFDRSDGLWVAVLLRAYAQRVLRSGLDRSVAASGAPPALQALLVRAVDSSDLVLDAYDRAIRGLVNQSGGLTGSALRAHLQSELAALPLPSPVAAAAAHWLLTPASLDSLAAMLQSNAEIFGAYRAAGNGGLPGQVLAAFAGGAHPVSTVSLPRLALDLAAAQVEHRAVVAGILDTTLDQRRAAGEKLPAGIDGWYISRHAYSVLGYDGLTVKLRNPWGMHPAPDGEFSLTLPEFARFFPMVVIQDK